MVAMPFIINKIGAKRGLQLFAIVLIVRVVGSAFFTHTYLLIFWRLLAAVEMPLMLISVMKYITRMFDVQISATRSEEHTSELQSRGHIVCRLPLEKKK